MGIFRDQARNIATSAVVSATLPEEINQAKDVVWEALPENMKAAVAVSSIAASIAYGAIKERGQEQA
jgi:hypothetical protein